MNALKCAYYFWSLNGELYYHIVVYAAHKYVHLHIFHANAMGITIIHIIAKIWNR